MRTPHRVAVRPVVRLLPVCLLAILLGGCGAETEPPQPDPTSRRSTPSGEVVGFVADSGAHVWLGLPFAEAPEGRLRWRAPEPPRPWEGVREALAVGARCPQYSSSMEGRDPGQLLGDEDCLFANVYARRRDPGSVPEGDDLRPVMVWIHGGGNTIGHAGFYDGGTLAATHDVVVVAVNYRLGPFGWFRHPALHGEGDDADDRSGNYGTLDLVRALEWVRRHAPAFGGDPENVTIFGESAGGRNVVSLLVSPRSRGLFQRAVVQSGGTRTTATDEAELPESEGGHTASSAETLVRALVASGRAGDPEAARRLAADLPSAEVEELLRGLSAGDLLALFEPRGDSGMIEVPQLFRDGAVLPGEEIPEVLARPGGAHPVPVVLGTNRDENRLFMFADPRHVRRFLWIFWRLRDEEQYVLSSDYMARMWKATGADGPAARLAGAGHPGVWVYRFDWDEEPTILGADLSVMLGAAHAFEIPFVFGHFDLGRAGNMIFTDENEPGRLELSSRMMSYWARFAAAGDPGRGVEGSLPLWPAWRPEGPRTLVFDTEEDGGLEVLREAETPERVLADVGRDPRLAQDARARCTVLRQLATWSSAFEREDYARREDCTGYPFDGFPWE